MNKNKCLFRTFAIAALMALSLNTAYSNDDVYTLTNIKDKTVSYLSQDHSVYVLSKNKDTNSSSITINNEEYYYNPSKDDIEIAETFKNLGHFLKETNANNALFSAVIDNETKYYTFDTNNMPKSIYSLSTANNSGENIISLYRLDETTKTLTPYYYNVDLTKKVFGHSNTSKELTIPGINGGTYTIIANYDDSANREHLSRLEYNSSSTVDNIEGDFVDLTSNKFGAAINNSGKIGIDSEGNVIGGINSNFINNTINFQSSVDGGGGVISNSGDIGYINGNFINNTNLSSWENRKGMWVYGEYSKGGAIYNTGKINSITGDFVNNYTQKSGDDAYGGAIYNNNTIGDIKGNFIANYTKGSRGIGGAIFNVIENGLSNTTATIKSITGDFIGNYADSSDGYAGAIGNMIRTPGDNELSVEIGNINGNFIGNHIINSSYSYGGVIYNAANSSNAISTAKIGDITGNFIGNYIICSAYAYGGVIYNTGNISSAHAEIGNITGDFIGNYVDSPYQAHGGAIYNNGQMKNITGDFIGNYVKSVKETGYLYGSTYGGAIYNAGKINNITGNFIDNYGITNQNSMIGGAILSSDSIMNITGNFINNYAIATNTASGKNAYGGALANTEGYLRLVKGNFDANYVESYNSSGGGAIYFKNTMYIDSFLDNIEGNFTQNYAKAKTGNAQGGAIFFLSYRSDRKTEYRPELIYMQNIIGKFISNYVNSEDGEAQGGAIYFKKGELNNVLCNFENNYAYSKNGNAKGGAVYIEDALFHNFSSSFTGNRAITEGGNALGGAIYTNTDMTFFADNKKIEFTGNYISNDNGETRKYQAIYADKVLDENGDQISVPTLTFKAVNKGEITLNDYIDGADGYKVVLTGDENSKINLFNDIKNADIDANNVNINLADNKIKEYNFNSLNSDASAKYTIDVSADNKSDKIIAGSNSTGTVYIDSINVIGQDLSDNFNIKVLDSESETLQLAISSQIANKKYKVGTITNVLDDKINENVYFDDEFYKKSQIGTLFGKMTLASSDKEGVYDSLVISLDNSLTQWGDIVVNGKLGDTLKLISELETTNSKNFNFKSSKDIYKLSSNLDFIVGTLNINGIMDNESLSTIDLNKYSGFKLSNNSELNLNNVTLTGNDSLISVSGTNAKVNLNNTVLDGNISSSDKYSLGLSGSNTIIGNVGNANAVMYDGILYLPSNNHFSSADLTVNSGILNLVNNKTQNQLMNSLTVNGNLGLLLEADLANVSMDRLPENTTVANGAVINVHNIKLLSDSSADLTEIPFAYESFKNNVNYLGANDLTYDVANSIAYSPVYKYSVSYNPENGFFSFAKGSNLGSSYTDYNPAVLSTTVSAQSGAYSTVNNTNNYALQSIDNIMAIPYMERLSLKNKNKYAVVDNSSSTYSGIFSPIFTKSDEKGFWIKPYTSFENVPLKNGPRVSNISYGTLVGADSNIYEFSHGWEGIFTGYFGYNGASQRYLGVDSIQNGALIGATASFYKNNFFNATTISVGANIAENTNMYGKEDFSMLISGAANKTGYNFEFLNGKLIIQPTVSISYTFVNTFDYNNSAGVRIKSDPLHAIQVSPGIKAIGNTKNHWQPYISANVIWDVFNSTKVTADNIELPKMSVKPYAQYGIGVQKQFKQDRLTAFAQAMIQNGGRNGISFSSGLRWSLGSSDNNKKAYSSGERKIIKSINNSFSKNI